MATEHEEQWEVVVVGAGPAGLSAALTLGRCRRRTLVCDRGTPRNWASKEMHGYLTRDGIKPDAFTHTALQEIGCYTSVVYRRAEVKSAHRTEQGFLVHFNTGERAHCKKLLLATGLFDELPKLEGVEQFFGRSVFQCPYCDGWEFQDRPLAAYGKGHRGLPMARALTAWSADIVLCTDGTNEITPKSRSLMERNGIRIFTQPIKRLHGAEGLLRAIEFADGSTLKRQALFFDTRCEPQSSLAKDLGCRFKEDGGIRCGRYEATGVPGLYVAGNILKDVHLAVVAAGEGAKAAFGINKALTRENSFREIEFATYA